MPFIQLNVLHFFLNTKLSWNISAVFSDNVHPGTATDQLKDHLKEEFDYSLVPEKGWEKLVEWYGLAADSRPIPRKVIEYGLYKEHHEVEVYLLNVKLAMHPILTEHVVKEFSRGETVGKCTSRMPSA